jgi:hypothetical protein
MLYYVKSGSLNICQNATCHKQAAMTVLRDRESEFGEFVIVGTDEITENSDYGKMMAFSTNALILESNRGMRLVG